jgi:general secretion pathway protein A
LYREFYGLKEKPFALLPDPRFIYLGSSHREALAHLMYGIEEGEGFIEVIGQVGTGKTTLCRTLLDRLRSDIDVAFIFNPSQTEIELLQNIHREFGLPSEGKGRSELLDELNEFLLKTRAAGRRAVLVIDEAQNLPRDVLEQVRILSNLETEREKLLQIVLIGQPELEQNLSRSDLRQLRQRITVRWGLRPFNRTEMEDYVMHRLRVAGWRSSEPLFTGGALRVLYWASQGTPRLINAMADRAMLAGYGLRRERIDAWTVYRASREMLGSPTRSSRVPSVLRAAAGIVLASLAVGAGLYGITRLLTAREPYVAGPEVEALEAADLAVRDAVATAPEVEIRRLAPTLLERSPAQTAADSLARVLQLWGIDSRIPSEVEPSEMMSVLKSVSNLRLSPDFTNLKEIVALGYPVILEIEPKPGQARYVVLQNLIGEDLASVAAGDQIFALGLGALQRFWTGRALFVWRNFESLPMLTPGDARGGVRWVQASLVRLGFMKPGDPSGEYDERTEAAIRTFQSSAGLSGTGQFGFKTVMALYAALDARAVQTEGRPVYGGPRLRRATGGMR